MNCSTVTEFLPWLLNGTLDAEERRQVEAHLAACESCREELRQTRIAGAVYGAHPPPQALVDHAAGRPPAGIPAGLLSRHLAACPTCTEEVALLRQSHVLAGAEEEAGGDPPGATVVAGPWSVQRWRHFALAASIAGLVALGVSAWSVLQSRTGASDLAARLAQAEERSRVLATENERLQASEAESRSRVAELADRAEAADLAASELEERLEQERNRLAQLEERSGEMLVGLQVEFLDRAETVARGGPEALFGGEDGRPTVARQDGTVLLSLALPAGAEVHPTRLEVVNAADVVVLDARGPPPGKDSLAYYMVLPTRQLDPGPYTLRLWSTGNGEDQLLGTYPVQVE